MKLILINHDNSLQVEYSGLKMVKHSIKDDKYDIISTDDGQHYFGTYDYGKAKEIMEQVKQILKNDKIIFTVNSEEDINDIKNIFNVNNDTFFFNSDGGGVNIDKSDYVVYEFPPK